MSSDDEAKAAAPKTGGSRFLRKAGESDSGSDSESESEEESSSDDEEKGKKKSRFLRTDATDEDSSDEDGGKRVVKSARDKRLEEMETSGKQMDNALKINDWVAISNGEFFIANMKAMRIIDRRLQNSTNLCAWLSGSRMLQSLFRHSTFAPLPTSNPLSMQPSQRRRKPRKK